MISKAGAEVGRLCKPRTMQKELVSGFISADGSNISIARMPHDYLKPKNGPVISLNSMALGVPN